MRPEFWIKESERFTANPLKDEVKMWILGITFMCAFIIVACNIIRIYIR